MIKLNGNPLGVGSFPDGTLLFKVLPESGENGVATIEWLYENDRELVALIFLTNHLRDHGVERIQLVMPYIPNARQDRVKQDEDVFTLKYFAGIINSMNFESVTVLDPHSSVSEANLNNIKVCGPKKYVEQVISEITESEGEAPLMFYPDKGACDRYSDLVDGPFAYGIKQRDWKTGLIKGLDIGGAAGEIVGKNILIVDDICSKGGTFYHAAKKLKELGAKNIYLYVSHCENSIFQGQLPESGLVKKVFTTNSIYNGDSEFVKVFKFTA